MNDVPHTEPEPAALVRVDYERTTSVYIPQRRWEGYQVLRTELQSLVRCVKQGSDDQQFFGIAVGATITLALTTAASWSDPTLRMVYVGFTVICAIASLYFHKRTRSMAGEIDQIVKVIEEDQPQRLRAM